MHNQEIKTRINNAISKISSITIIFLNSVLPFLLYAFIWFGISFCVDTASDPIKALDTYSPMIEYLMMSLFIAVSGAIILDIAIAESSRE